MKRLHLLLLSDMHAPPPGSLWHFVQTAEAAGLAAEGAADAAKKGLAWAKDQIAARLPKREKKPPEAQ